MSARRWLWPASESSILRHENHRDIYYEHATCRPEHIIAPDSDDELDSHERKAKRQRIVRLSKAFISGQPLYISSAVLRGPFEENASQRWRGKARENVPDSSRNRKPSAVTAASLPAARKVRPEFVPRRLHRQTSFAAEKPVSTPTPAPNASLARTVSRVSAVVLPQVSPSTAQFPLDRHSSPHRTATILQTKDLSPQLPTSDELLDEFIEPDSYERSPPVEPPPLAQCHGLSHSRAPQFQDRLEDICSPPATPGTSLQEARELSRKAIAARVNQAGIESAKSLSQKALKQHAIQSCRKTGKLPSLNRFAHLGSKLRGPQRSSALSPFVFRKVIRESVVNAGELDAETPGKAETSVASSNVQVDNADAPMPSTQSMLQEAHVALLQTIRRNRQNPDVNATTTHMARQQQSQSPVPAIRPFSVFDRDVSPTTGIRAATPPLNTQAMFDAFTPFSAPTELYPAADAELETQMNANKQDQELRRTRDVVNNNVSEDTKNAKPDFVENAHAVVEPGNVIESEIIEPQHVTDELEERIDDVNVNARDAANDIDDTDVNVYHQGSERSPEPLVSYSDDDRPSVEAARAQVAGDNDPQVDATNMVDSDEAGESDDSEDSEPDPLGQQFLEYARASQMAVAAPEPSSVDLQDSNAEENDIAHDTTFGLWSSRSASDAEDEKIDTPLTQEVDAENPVPSWGSLPSSKPASLPMPSAPNVMSIDGLRTDNLDQSPIVTTIEPSQLDKTERLTWFPARFSMSPTDPVAIDPVHQSRDVSLQNAQRAPSIDIDMTMTDLQENVLGSWDVYDAIRQEVEAV